MSRGDVVTVRGCAFPRETDDAILVTTDEDPDGQWVPFSHVVEVVRGATQEGNAITMTAWIASRKGFE